MTWPFRKPQRGQTMWEARPTPAGFQPDERDIAGFRVRMKRRKPTFLEEIAISSVSRDGKGSVLPLRVLAGVVEVACRDIEHGVPDEAGVVKEWMPLDLTVERCLALDNDAELAVAFIDWLAKDSIANITGQKKEELKKKRGP